ncbi:hypothetical protein ABET51_00060 [Metabacillus fastidiosus]|uniref:hypothetical protein n=1 Tax=Metabacillus fastidiosus TaxID=1458 RepID=UPI003D2CEFD7
MKQSIFLFILSLFLLIGCSNNNTEKEAAANNKQEEKTETANNTPEYYKNYVPNPQVINDQNIQNTGQTFHDEKGEATLKTITAKKQTKKIGAIELTIREAKILDFRPAHSLIDFYHTYTHDEEFTFVKLFVEIKNTSNETIKFAPVATLNTNANELKTWEDDIYLEELNGEIEANSLKSGNLGFIIEKANINSIEITTSDVFNKDDQKLDSAEKINISF